MPLILLLGLGAGLFAGSQIDDALERPTAPIGGGVNQGIPLYVKVPLIIAGGTAAFFLTKKIIKKI